MRTLLLIKHSEPDIVEGLPAKTWRLSARGRRRCEPLARAIAPYSPDLIISSAEIKARETGELLAEKLGLNLVLAENLHEHEREQVPFLSDADFRENVRLLLEKPDELVMGSETANQARRRFEKAIHQIVESYPQKNLAVVAHGTVISLFVSQHTGLDSFTLWQRLKLPGVVILSLPQFGLVEIMERVE